MSNIEGTKRAETEPIPKPVMREAVVNAVCHRDYSMATRRIGIARFDDRVEITSPGPLGNTLNIEKIKVGNSAPRNMLLLKFLDNMRYIDGLGRGIPLMIKLMGDRVIFEELGDLFRVTLRFD